MKPLVAAGLGLAFLTTVSAALWGLLAATGDATGAAVARVLTILFLICWWVVAWGLLAILAWTQGEDSPPPDPDELEAS